MEEGYGQDRRQLKRILTLAAAAALPEEPRPRRPTPVAGTRLSCRGGKGVGIGEGEGRSYEGRASSHHTGKLRRAQRPTSALRLSPACCTK